MCTRVPDHLEYDSQMLAQNAATLHGMELPRCPGINPFPCPPHPDAEPEHWHIGHPQRWMGQLCRKRHADWSRGVPRERDTLQPSP